ncbi:MAG: uracil phosphoribosyltransferase [Spirochaetota bacterium]
MIKVEEVKHPLISHKLTILRDKNTKPTEFREVVEELALLLLFRATQNLEVVEVEVETPLEKAKGALVKEDIVIIPILRAGTGMKNPLLKIMPDASVYHLGIYRNEETLEAEEYYSKLPKDLSESVVFILDPMFATGSTFKYALDLIIKRNPKKVIYLSIVSSPQAIENLKNYPYDFEMYTASIDRDLNENGYILPGLGDAGDRIYGTYPRK